MCSLIFPYYSCCAVGHLTRFFLYISFHNFFSISIIIFTPHTYRAHLQADQLNNQLPIRLFTPDCISLWRSLSYGHNCDATFSFHSQFYFLVLILFFRIFHLAWTVFEVAIRNVITGLRYTLGVCRFTGICFFFVASVRVCKVRVVIIDGLLCDSRLDLITMLQYSDTK